MHLVDWLDDLTVRFLLNLPASELTSMYRICFQIEEAQWYYEDFVRPQEAAAGNNLPHLSLKDFCLAIFRQCPYTRSFTDQQHKAAYDAFLAYKVRVPVRGAILLDESMERAVLVRGWKKGANWSFPRGKINKDEPDLDCAIREVYEETGFDIRAEGFAPKDDSKADFIEATMREQHMRLYVIRGIPLDTKFETQTRKEISKIEWFNLRDLPGYAKNKKDAQQETDNETLSANKFYMVAPFLGPLKRYVALNKRKAKQPSDVEEQVPIQIDQQSNIISDVTNASNELKNVLNIASPHQPATLQPGLPLPTQVSHSPGSQHQQRLDLQRLFAVQAPQHHQLQHGQFQPSSPPPTHPGSFQNTHTPDGRMLPGLGVSQQYNVAGVQPLAMLAPGANMQHQRLTLPTGLNDFHRQQAHHYHHDASLHQYHNQQQQQLPQQEKKSQPQSQPQTQSQERLGQQLAQQVTAAHSAYSSSEQPSRILAAPKASELPVPKLNAHTTKLLNAFKQDNSQTKSPLPNQPVQQPTRQQKHLLTLLGGSTKPGANDHTDKRYSPAPRSNASDKTLQQERLLSILGGRKDSQQAPNADNIAPQRQPAITILRRPSSAVDSPPLGSPKHISTPKTTQQENLLALFGKAPSAERKSSNSATPTEAKEFLLGFLNNVVQKEGRPA